MKAFNMSFDASGYFFFKLGKRFIFVQKLEKHGGWENIVS
jgi:hypothetical protein